MQPHYIIYYKLVGSIKFRYTSTEEVERIIKSLKPKNAQG
jgi:hypothetical protein